MLTVTKTRRFTTVFEQVVATNQSARTVGALLRRETDRELARLRNESPRATGLLAKSWRGFTNASTIAAKQLSVGDVVDVSDYPALAAIKLREIKATTAYSLFIWFRRKNTLKTIPRKYLLTVCQKLIKYLRQKDVNKIRLYIRINNTAPNSYYRIVGRAAGKMPPVKKLAAWAKRKGLPESAGYAVAKLIAKQGTARYRSGQNVVGIDPTSQTYRGDAGFVRLVSRVLAHL